MAVSAADNLMVYEQTQEAAINIRVEDYLYLVNRIAHHIMGRMPSNVQVDDLIQAGMVGLLEAAQKYDAEKGASFETYAGIRIRGAIVDEMRRGDWAPRSVHRNTRRVADAIKKVEASLGRDAKDVEVARELDISLDEYHEMLRDTNSTRLFSLEETFEEDEGRLRQSNVSEALLGPAEGVQKRSLQQALVEAIKNLPEREQLVLSLYYDKELNLKEIGLVLGVSESRVSQIHSQAALRLRARLSDWQR
ncbi:RNA polymerase, sigma 28 subunit, SigD/FliA/WhiG [Alteromonadaceae bacterium Bs31]|nr:RNA polymerase, sigma 28 subunit, SigD/FliA/WhiG [Alteromonadaceae bacterium Bs31]